MNPVTHTVAPGETLSGIGAKYGVDYNQISGYKSGNPNLIYPGEVLNIPGAKPGTAPAPAPITPASTGQPTQQPQVQQTGGAGGNFGSWLRSHGYNDPNVINAAVANPASAGSAYQDYLRETGAGGGGSMGMPQAPVFDLVAATNAAYNTPEIQAANKAITDRQAALAKASADINDNPFYSEATRVGKQASLTDRANADITVQQNILAGFRADAAIKLNAATGQYNINRQAYQDNLSRFNMILQAGGLTNASPQDLANMAVSTGFSVSELQSIQKTQQDKNLTTSLVTNNDGTVSVLNAKTGEVIHQTQPGVGPVKTPKGGGGSAGLSNIQYNKVKGYLALQDTINTGGKGADGKLSASEVQAAIGQVQSYLGVDQQTAADKVASVMNSEDYQLWTPPTSTKSTNTGLLGNLSDWWSGLTKSK